MFSNEKVTTNHVLSNGILPIQGWPVLLNATVWANQGGTVARALWHEFPRDNNTWTIGKSNGRQYYPFMIANKNTKS